MSPTFDRLTCFTLAAEHALDLEEIELWVDLHGGYSECQRSRYQFWLPSGRCSTLFALKFSRVLHDPSGDTLV